VFWTDAAHGTVMRAPAAGGAPVTLASGQDAPTEIGLFGDTLYWLNRSGARALMKVAAAGGTPAVVATAPPAVDAGVVDGGPAYVPPPAAGINGFTVADDGTVYFSSSADVYSLPAAGGAPSPVVEFTWGWPVALALDGATLVIASGNSVHVYAIPLGGSVVTCGGPAGDVCAFARHDETSPAQIFVQAGRAYWIANIDSGELVSAPIDPGGTPPEWTSEFLGGIQALTVHGTSAFLALDEGSIIEAALAANATGTPIAREPGLPQPVLAPFPSKSVTSIAADDSSVFWATREYASSQSASATCVIHAVRR
jgi:hypothetical protein